MANFLFALLPLLLQFTIYPSLAQNILQSESPAPNSSGQKLTHLRVYWHDILTGPNPTAVRVAQSSLTNASSTYFGAVTVIDDVLTAGPDLISDLVGRAQGMYTSCDKDQLAALMTMNFVFTNGDYNGSTISIFGHNHVFSAVREMSIVGGTGIFRLATGYAQASNNITMDPVEYNLFVTHY